MVFEVIGGTSEVRYAFRARGSSGTGTEASLLLLLLVGFPEMPIIRGKAAA